MRRFASLHWRLLLSHVLIALVCTLVLILAAHLIAATAVGDRLLPAASAEEEEAFELTIDRGAIVAGVAALLVSAVVSIYLTERAVRPLRELSAASRLMALGNYRVRVDLGHDDELATLSQHMNELARALDETEQRRLALISDVAHELRTPLMTIDSYAEGMIDGVIAAGPESLTLIQREVARMRRVVEDLSLLSRAEAGALPVKLTTVDLAALLGYLVAQFAPQCEEEGLALTAELPPGLPLVLADQQRIEQVLINMLVNAVRYTPSGGAIHISAEPAGGAVRVAVSDTGVGIAAGELPHIFDRFYRIDASRELPGGGTGVGLTIARHLMRAQGGEIWAESPGPGAGATFFITVPRA